MHAHIARDRGHGLAGSVSPSSVRFDFWRSMGDLAALVLRSGAPQLRLRIAAALILVFVGKFCGVIAPVMLGEAINTLTPTASGGVVAGASFIGLAVAFIIVSIACDQDESTFAPVTPVVLSFSPNSRTFNNSSSLYTFFSVKP